MSATTSIAVGAAAFLLALGVVLWAEMGPAMFTALTEFGVFICG